MNVTKYAKKAIFRQKVKITDYSKPVKGYLTFMTCDATKCLPPTDEDFEFTIAPKKAAAEPATPNQKPTAVKKKENPIQIVETKPQPSTSKVIAAETKAQVLQIEDKNGNAVDIEIQQPKIVSRNQPTATSKPSTSVSASPVTKIEKPSTVKKDFTANIDEGWTIYSQHTSDDGPVPTSFNFDETEFYTLDGSTQEEGKRKEGYDKLFDTNVIKFVKGPVSFTQKIKPTDASEAITGYLTYMTCDDSRCLPPTDIDFVLFPDQNKGLLGADASKHISILAGTQTEAPTKAGTSSFSGVNISGDVIDQVRPIVRETFVTPVGDCGEENIASSSLLWTFIFGFLGGLLALLTPCVFPMIPLTVSYFTKGSTDRASGIRNGLIYGASIIVIYIAIGLIITGVFGPTALNELSTNWIANVLFFVVFILFAFSFFG